MKPNEEKRNGWEKKQKNPWKHFQNMSQTWIYAKSSLVAGNDFLKSLKFCKRFFSGRKVNFRNIHSCGDEFDTVEPPTFSISPRKGPHPKLYPRGPLAKLYPRGPLPKLYPRGPPPKLYPRGPLARLYPKGPLAKLYPRGPPEKFCHLSLKSNI